MLVSISLESIQTNLFFESPPQVTPIHQTESCGLSLLRLPISVARNSWRPKKIIFKVTSVAVPMAVSYPFRFSFYDRQFAVHFSAMIASGVICDFLGDEEIAGGWATKTNPTIFALNLIRGYGLAHDTQDGDAIGDGNNESSKNQNSRKAKDFARQPLQRLSSVGNSFAGPTREQFGITK